MPMHDWTKVDSGTYHYFHMRWIGSIGDALNERLPKAYYAMAEQRIDGGRIPDVLALTRHEAEDDAFGLGAGEAFGSNGNGGGSVAVSTPRARLVEAATADEFLTKQNHVAVRTTSGDRLVAIVEIVSPGNRSADWPLRSFVDKCRTLMKQGIHLLIVDPFPPDPRAPKGLHALVFEEFSASPVPVPADKPLSLIAYECRHGVRAYLETLAVGDPLVEMRVFLPLSDRFVEVPLEEAYLAAWNSMPARWRNVIAPPRTEET